MAVNMNFCTVILRKCRAGYIEGTKLETVAKDLVILWPNRAFEYQS